MDVLYHCYQLIYYLHNVLLVLRNYKFYRFLVMLLKVNSNKKQDIDRTYIEDNLI